MSNMGTPIDPRLLDSLRELPPLFPHYLQRRRVGVPVVGALLVELGIERPLLFALVQIDTTQGAYGGEEVTLAELRTYNPYQVIDYYSGRVAQLKESGLVAEKADGRLALSAEARVAVDRLHNEATNYVAGRAVLPDQETERLARELRRAADAVVVNPALIPRPGSHLAAFRAMSRYGDQSASMVHIEQAIGELWGARDDAYTTAWRNADMEGPAMDVLSHIWLGVDTMRALTETLKTKQTTEDIESSLLWLVEREYAQRDGDGVSLTPQGVIVRDDIERETDRVYFDAWGFDTEVAIWIRKTLRELIDKLS